VVSKTRRSEEHTRVSRFKDLVLEESTRSEEEIVREKEEGKPFRPSRARGAYHPERRQEIVAMLAKERAPKLPDGWCWPLGWRIKLFLPSGAVTFRETRASATYEDAVKIRDREMRTGLYEKAWLERILT
jgi:hypothetical protein